MLGHLIPVMVGLPFVVEAQIPLSIDEWLIALLAVLLVWGFLWLVQQSGIDHALTFDPHFLLVPAGMSALLIGLFIFLVPELRLLLLHGWYAVLLFGAGLFGFRDSLAMNTIMVVTYLVVIGCLIGRGEALSWTFEVPVIVPSYALCPFCQDAISEQEPELPTRQGIITAVHELIASTNGNDIVVIYFSGHGSELYGRELYAGQRFQSIVTHDSGRGGAENRDIIDREIEGWIRDFSCRTPYLTLIFDCCHSGGVTSIDHSHWQLRSRR
jgi:hypothetical protein